MSETNVELVGHKRQGKTGVWTFMLRTPGGKIIATSQWGKNYEFDEKQWLDLPVVELPYGGVLE